MIEFFLCTIIVLLVVLVAVLAKSLNETKTCQQQTAAYQGLARSVVCIQRRFPGFSQSVQEHCAYQAIDEIQYCQLEPSQRNNQDEMA